MDKFEITCRTCNTERHNLINLTSNIRGNDTLKLCDVLITICPSLSIPENDKLPQKICYFCSKQLEIAYKFQMQCKKSHEELTKIVESTVNIKSEPVTSPLQHEDLQINENEEDKLSIEEEFEDGLSSLSENLEFLDEDIAMEENDNDDLTEELLDTEGNSHQQSVVDVEPLTAAENEAPIMCCHCDKKFFTANGLRLHEKLSHKNLKPILIDAEILTIECKSCLEVFEKQSDLIKHFRLEHRNAADHTCNICKKTFSGKNRLEHHLLYHGKMQFRCLVQECKRTFVLKYKLTDHMKRFHGMALTTSETRSLKPSVVKES